MSYIFFRVPHYVASYIRNRDPKNRVAPGEDLKKGHVELVMHIIKEGLVLNADDRVMKNGCFSERQWNRMTNGYCIYGKGNARPVLQAKTNAEPLTDAEVKLLSGYDCGNGSGDGEYLRVPIPEEILINGVVYRTNKSYTLSVTAAEEMRSRLTQDFRRSFLEFMNTERDVVLARRVERTTIESIERFMARYDIRNGEENVERNTLKRNFYRWRADKVLNPEDYVDHAD